MSRKNFEQSIKSFSDQLEQHIDSYLESVTMTLENTIDDFIQDWKDENGGLNVTDSDYLKKAFLTGKDAFKDKLEAFYDSGCEFRSQYDLEEALENIIEENEDYVKSDDADDKEAIYDKLKTLGESLHLSDNDIYQTQILRLLEDEFDIKLIALPQSHKTMF